MNLLRPFYNLRIAYKLFLSYSAVFVLAVILGSMVIYSRVRNTIEFNIESELKNSTETILNLVQTTVAVSIKNHLRAVAEKNRETVEYFYGLYRQGLVTEEEAKSRAGAVLLNQTIGETGYIFVWDIRNAPQSIPLSVHPKIQGKDVAYVDFVQAGAKLKNGYMEYEWKNPGEEKAREKAMYLSYFEPWQWVVAASSYREEFNKLVNVDDFRDSIMSLRFGKTGYPYVIDTKGNIIIHPHLKGNLYDLTDAQGRLFIKEICTQKNGKIIYPWKDPEGKAFREKLVIFNYIPEYDWIVASSCNLDEIYDILSDQFVYHQTAAETHEKFFIRGQRRLVCPYGKSIQG
ncbi:MAG: cache domain-containing protein [Deltaproteobacteria bacterium]|nr:cache domain-containing protein [Deltaproteobacteria bacterium]